MCASLGMSISEYQELPEQERRFHERAYSEVASDWNRQFQ